MTPAFSGVAPSGGNIGLLVTTSESTPRELADSLEAAGSSVESIGVLNRGEWRLYVPGAPDIVNEPFPRVIAETVPFFVRSRADLRPATSDFGPANPPMLLYGLCASGDVITVLVDDAPVQSVIARNGVWLTSVSDRDIRSRGPGLVTFLLNGSATDEREFLRNGGAPWDQTRGIALQTIAPPIVDRPQHRESFSEKTIVDPPRAAQLLAEALEHVAAIKRIVSVIRDAGLTSGLEHALLDGLLVAVDELGDAIEAETGDVSRTSDSEVGPPAQRGGTARFAIRVLEHVVGQASFDFLKSSSPVVGDLFDQMKALVDAAVESGVFDEPF